jgi:hypothetical protein
VRLISGNFRQFPTALPAHRSGFVFSFIFNILALRLRISGISDSDFSLFEFPVPESRCSYFRGIRPRVMSCVPRITTTAYSQTLQHASVFQVPTYGAPGEQQNVFALTAVSLNIDLAKHGKRTA